MRAPTAQIAALALTAFGVLLFLEVIRPFRDMNRDGPLAMICWGIGFLVSLVALYKGSRFRVLSWVGLVLNAMALIAVSVLLLLLRHSNFAWH